MGADDAKPKFKLSMKMFREVEARVTEVVKDVEYEVVVGEKRKHAGWEEEIAEHFRPKWRNRVLVTPEEVAVLERHVRYGGYFSVSLVTDYSVDGTEGRVVALNPASVAYFKQHTSPSHNMTIQVNGLAYALPTHQRIDWLYELVTSVRVAKGLPPYRDVAVVAEKPAVKPKKGKR